VAVANNSASWRTTPFFSSCETALGGRARQGALRRHRRSIRTARFQPTEVPRPGPRRATSNSAVCRAGRPAGMLRSRPIPVRMNAGRKGSQFHGLLLAIADCCGGHETQQTARGARGAQRVLLGWILRRRMGRRKPIGSAVCSDFPCGLAGREVREQSELDWERKLRTAG